MQHLALGKILSVNVWVHVIHCRASFFSAPWLQRGPIRIGAGDSANEGYQSDLLQDVASQGHHMLPCKAHVLGLILLQDSINPDLLLPLKINEATSQVPHVPVGDRMLFNHHLRYYRVLQVGMDVAISLTEVCGVLLGTPGVSLDRFFSKQKNREFKLKYLKKLFDNNNIFMRRYMEETSISRLSRCWLRGFGFWYFLSWKRKCRRIGCQHSQGSST